MITEAQLQQQISDILGHDSNHALRFNFQEKDGLCSLYLETVHPRYDQMFLFHATSGTDRIDALQKMLDYVKTYKEKSNSYTIQWSAHGERGVRTSYFTGASIEEALEKFSYGRDRNKTTIFLISLNPNG